MEDESRKDERWEFTSMMSRARENCLEKRKGENERHTGGNYLEQGEMNKK